MLSPTFRPASTTQHQLTPQGGRRITERKVDQAPPLSLSLKATMHVKKTFGGSRRFNYFKIYIPQRVRPLFSNKVIRPIDFPLITGFVGQVYFNNLISPLVPKLAVH